MSSRTQLAPSRKRRTAQEKGGEAGAAAQEIHEADRKKRPRRGDRVSAEGQEDETTAGDPSKCLETDRVVLFSGAEHFCSSSFPSAFRISAASPESTRAEPAACAGDDDRTYFHVDQYLEAAKARLFRDHATLQRVLGSPSADMCKKWGRRVRNYDGPAWDRAARGVMARALSAKFHDNPELGRLLLGTGDRAIAEASSDRVWGIGRRCHHKEALDPARWAANGSLNWLGQLLEQTRAELAVEGSSEETPSASAEQG